MPRCKYCGGIGYLIPVIARPMEYICRYPAQDCLDARRPE